MESVLEKIKKNYGPDARQEEGLCRKCKEPLNNADGSLCRQCRAEIENSWREDY